MTDPVVLVIDALAIYRLSRLVTSDTLLDTPRNWLLRRWPGEDTSFYDSMIEGIGSAYPVIAGTLNPVRIESENPRVWFPLSPHWFGTWAECVWCVSVAVAVVVVAARQWWDWWQWPALVAAGSAAAGWIHNRSQ